MIIGNIGLGLLVLILVWIIALIVFVVGIKFQNNVAWIALGSVAVFTLILVVIPLENPAKTLSASDHLDKDYSLIYRFVFLSFLVLSALLGFVFFFILHCIEPIRPKPIKQFY